LAKKTPPCPEYPEWTTAKYFSLIRTGLRGAFSRWPPKHEALKAVKEVVPVMDGEEQARYKTGQRAGQLKYTTRYRCAACDNLFPIKEVETDHIVPAGSLKTYDDVVPFIQRVLCPVEGLQVLCKTCHREKTNAERRKNKTT
jgi:hypothetical protein